MIGVAVVTYGLAWRHALHRPPTLGTVMLWALVFRAIGVCGEPLLEDDHYRYMWDGYRFAVSGSPYGAPPEAFFADSRVPSVLQPVLSQINHPDIPTIYGPALEHLFRIAYLIAPGQIWPLKLVLIGADLLLIGLLNRLTSARNVLLYAWNPLVIKEVAFTAHPDGLLGLLLITAWTALATNRQVWAGFALAGACLAKVSAWPMVPFFARRLGGLGLCALLIVWLLVYLPFWLAGATDATGLRAFGERFEFNSLLYGLARSVLPATVAKTLTSAVFLICLVVYFRHDWRQSRRALPRGDLIFGALLLASPVVNPWYLLWLLPFAAVYPSCAAWTASIAVLLSYATGLNLNQPALGAYDHPGWVRPIEYGAIAAAFALDWVRWRHPAALARWKRH